MRVCTYPVGKQGAWTTFFDARLPNYLIVIRGSLHFWKAINPYLLLWVPQRSLDYTLIFTYPHGLSFALSCQIDTITSF